MYYVFTSLEKYQCYNIHDSYCTLRDTTNFSYQLTEASLILLTKWFSKSEDGKVTDGQGTPW